MKDKYIYYIKSVIYTWLNLIKLLLFESFRATKKRQIRKVVKECMHV